MNCPQCGASIRTGQAFFGHFGATLQPAAGQLVKDRFKLARRKLLANFRSALRLIQNQNTPIFWLTQIGSGPGRS